MLNMIRAQMYRIAKSRSIWAVCLIIALFVLATPFALWLYQVWPAFAAAGIVELPDDPLPLLRIWGVSVVGGSAFPMMVGVLLALVFSEDFKSGYVKNLVQARGGRVSYALSAAACSVIVSCAVTVGAAALVALALAAQGYPFAMPTGTEALGWMAQVALCSVAYAGVAVLVVLVTGSEAAGVVAAVVVGGGMVETALRLVLANIPGAPAAVRDCLDSYLAVDIAQLGQGIVCDPLTYAQAVATLAAAVVLWLLVIRRKSLA